MSAREGTNEIGFAEFDSGVAENRVGSGDVKVKIRQSEIEKIIIARELHGVTTADGDGDLARLGAVKVGGTDGAEQLHRLVDALLQLVEALLRIVPFGRLATSQAED